MEVIVINPEELLNTETISLFNSLVEETQGSTPLILKTAISGNGTDFL
jgi:hypothetical protein